jgi:hypothetical protein
MSQTTFTWLLLAIVLAIPSVLAVGRVIDWMRRRSVKRQRAQLAE